MELIQSTILGIIQGITEFLPISSSGHLVLVPYLFGWDYKGLYFDVALHFGTMLAIVVFFFKDWVSIIKTAFNLQPSTFHQNNYPKNILWQIILASIPAAIVGLLINDYVEAHLHSPVLLAVNLVIFGLFLFASDKFIKSQKSINAIGYKTSIVMGLAQSIALIPGVSRSGVTMTAGRLMGLSRETAARYSFILGTPAMIGAFLLELSDISLGQLGLGFWLGVIASFISGILAIKFLLEFLKKSGFGGFAIYRIILAIIVILVVYLR